MCLPPASAFPFVHLLPTECFAPSRVPPLESMHLSGSKEPNRGSYHRARRSNCSLAPGVAGCTSSGRSSIRVLAPEPATVSALRIVILNATAATKGRLVDGFSWLWTQKTLGNGETLALFSGHRFDPESMDREANDWALREYYAELR